MIDFLSRLIGNWSDFYKILICSTCQTEKKRSVGFMVSQIMYQQASCIETYMCVCVWMYKVHPFSWFLASCRQVPRTLKWDQAWTSPKRATVLCGQVILTMQCCVTFSVGLPDLGLQVLTKHKWIKIHINSLCWNYKESK